MGPSHYLDEGYSTGHTPESSPERSLAECGIRLPLRNLGSLPYRLKNRDSLDSLRIETPESTSEAGRNSTSLPSAEKSLDAEVLTTTVLPQLSTERSLQHGGENQNLPPLAAAASNTGDSHGPPSSDRGLKHRSLTRSARLPPVKLPQRFHPDTSRSASNAGHSTERATLDGTALDAPPRNHSAARQEHGRYPTAQGATEQNDGLPQNLPAYQPRPLNLQRHRHGRLYRLLSSRSTERILNQFHRWIRLVFLDVLFLFIFLALTGIILLWGQLWRMNERLFPMTFDQVSGSWYGPVEFSYPQHGFILGITTTGIMIPLIPLAVIILTQFWIRNWLDFQAAVFALKKAMVMMYVALVCIAVLQSAQGADYQLGCSSKSSLSRTSVYFVNK